MNGSIVPATYRMYQASTLGLFFPIMYVFGLSILYMRTRNLVLVVGLQWFFLALFNSYFTYNGSNFFTIIAVSIAILTTGLLLYQIFAHSRQAA